MDGSHPALMSERNFFAVQDPLMFAGDNLGTINSLRGTCPNQYNASTVAIIALDAAGSMSSCGEALIAWNAPVKGQCIAKDQPWRSSMTIPAIDKLSAAELLPVLYEELRRLEVRSSSMIASLTPSAVEAFWQQIGNRIGNVSPMPLQCTLFKVAS
jgi:hypothetical protein